MATRYLMLQDLYRGLATGQGTGYRPRVAGGSVVFIPVVVALYRPGESEPYAYADAVSATAYPHKPAGEETPAEDAEFVIGAVVRQVTEADPAATPESRVAGKVVERVPNSEG